MKKSVFTSVSAYLEENYLVRGIGSMIYIAESGLPFYLAVSLGRWRGEVRGSWWTCSAITEPAEQQWLWIGGDHLGPHEGDPESLVRSLRMGIEPIFEKAKTVPFNLAGMESSDLDNVYSLGHELALAIGLDMPEDEVKRVWERCQESWEYHNRAVRLRGIGLDPDHGYLGALYRLWERSPTHATDLVAVSATHVQRSLFDTVFFNLERRR